ncbi:hypothetical protein Aperf_G00000000823 [Anoplocephala perfoliata]
MKLLCVLIICIALCSQSSAFRNFDSNFHSGFAKCSQPTCQCGGYTGYGCVDGNCTYICSDGFCNGYQAYKKIIPPTLQNNLISNWGYGAFDQKSPCNGGNCGYFGGCKSGYCAGYYDFRKCGGQNCRSGAFKGYGCKRGNCQVVCHDNACYLLYGYGANPPPPPPTPQVQKPLESIEESFQKKDEWMLRHMTGNLVLDMVKGWLKDKKVFDAMKPDGKEVKFILNEFRKRNRMQKRLEVWRARKRSELYETQMCPDGSKPLMRPDCGICSQICGQCCQSLQQQQQGYGVPPPGYPQGYPSQPYPSPNLPQRPYPPSYPSPCPPQCSPYEPPPNAPQVVPPPGMPPQNLPQVPPPPGVPPQNLPQRPYPPSYPSPCPPQCSPYEPPPNAPQVVPPPGMPPQNLPQVPPPPGVPPQNLPQRPYPPSYPSPCPPQCSPYEPPPNAPQVVPPPGMPPQNLPQVPPPPGVPPQNLPQRPYPPSYPSPCPPQCSPYQPSPNLPHVPPPGKPSVPGFPQYPYYPYPHYGYGGCSDICSQCCQILQQQCQRPSPPSSAQGGNSTQAPKMIPRVVPGGWGYDWSNAFWPFWRMFWPWM